ncbi:hypothetical protein J437_LFUL017317 [Ladona fulva]|uniref:Tetratricopeptide repeat protein 37 n=1 Tax=Ladona fulva TaxID=123851 RepID=A0A8K0KTF1_LADFU|nr:hypothetical protein J437_LFUL017317 [Ladona fulva]
MFQAAKLDPTSCTPFVFLGKLYYGIFRDKEKARRCFQKAFQLNPHSVEAGQGLSDTYRALGHMCVKARSSSLSNGDSSLRKISILCSCAGTSAKWAWLRLGLHHLEQDNPNEAIKCLQSAIRSDPTDRHCWESLADAYLARGSFLTALKSYQRVTELDSSAVYPSFQIASIKHKLNCRKVMLF